MRSCRKNTGPWLSSLTAAASAARSGERTTAVGTASARSRTRLPRSYVGDLSGRCCSSTSVRNLLDGRRKAVGEQVAVEFAHRERACVLAHLTEAFASAGECAQGAGERLCVPAWCVHACGVLLHELTQPAVHVDDDGLPRRERIEELVRRVDLERRIGSEDRQCDVGRAHEPGDVLAGNGWKDEDVVEALLTDAALKGAALASLSDDDDADLVVARPL